MRRALVIMVVLVALGIVAGVSADTGALPAPLQNEGGQYTWPGAVTLQTTPYPWGGGYVVSAGAYINCPFACIRPFSPGSSVSLDAHPTTGYLFTGWAVANHGQAQLPGVCAGTGTCVVTIDQAKDVVANFAIDPNGPLAHNDGKDGGGDEGCSESDTFAGLSFVGQGEECLVILTVIVNADGGSGSVNVEPPDADCSSEGGTETCTFFYSKGTVVDLDAFPGGGSSFTGWGGSCSGSGGCEVTMNHNRTVSAGFQSGGD